MFIDIVAFALGLGALIGLGLFHVTQRPRSYRLVLPDVVPPLQRRSAGDVPSTPTPAQADRSDIAAEPAIQVIMRASDLPRIAETPAITRDIEPVVMPSPSMESSSESSGPFETGEILAETPASEQPLGRDEQPSQGGLFARALERVRTFFSRKHVERIEPEETSAIVDSLDRPLPAPVELQPDNPAWLASMGIEGPQAPNQRLQYCWLFGTALSGDFREHFLSSVDESDPIMRSVTAIIRSSRRPFAIRTVDEAQAWCIAHNISYQQSDETNQMESR